MNKKLLKSVAALFAVSVLGVSCAKESATEPTIEYKDNTTKNDNTHELPYQKVDITINKLGLAFVTGLSGADFKGIPLDGDYSTRAVANTFAPVNKDTLSFATDEDDTTKLIATVEVAQTTVNSADAGDASAVEAYLQSILEPNGVLTKALKEIAVEVAEGQTITFAKDTEPSAANKVANSSEIAVSIRRGSELKVSDSTALKDLTSLEKLVIVVKFDSSGNSTWE